MVSDLFLRSKVKMSYLSLEKNSPQADRRMVLAGNHLTMAGENNDDGDDNFQGGLATKVRPKTKKPARYRVMLLNDDFTPMEFVVSILKDVFNKDEESALQIMLHVHQNGVGQCGVFPHEVAETKVMRVLDAARKNQHPLQCVMEKE